MPNNVGKIYLIDGCQHVCVEDNGDRGFFKPIGKEVENLKIKPTILARFGEIKECDGKS